MRSDALVQSWLWNGFTAVAVHGPLVLRSPFLQHGASLQQRSAGSRSLQVTHEHVSACLMACFALGHLVVSIALNLQEVLGCWGDHSVT